MSWFWKTNDAQEKLHTPKTQIRIHILSIFQSHIQQIAPSTDPSVSVGMCKSYSICQNLQSCSAMTNSIGEDE